MENPLSVEQAIKRLREAGASLKRALGAASQREVEVREVEVYAVSGALTDALARIAAARADLLTDTPMGAARDLAELRGEVH